jgi:hypothetical protein
MAHIEAWYILIDSDDIPFGEPHPVYLGHNDKIARLKTGIKDGPYKESLAHVNVTEMEVWKCRSLTLNGIGLDGIGELVGNLKLSQDEDSDCQKVSPWTRVMGLLLQEDEPLVVRIPHKGAQHLFLRIMFPAESVLLCLK